MKRKIVLPSLFVLNAFLVGMAPKTSKAGSVTTNYNPKSDSISYTIHMDSIYKDIPCFAELLKFKADSVENKKDSTEESAPSYNISWRGGAWVKYTADDGSGFIRTGGSRTWRNMNPGAIRNGEFAREYGSCGSAGGFAVFPTEEHGMRALLGLLRSDKYAPLTIAAAIYKYAPPRDNNNTRDYQRKMLQITGISLKKRMCQLTAADLERVALAIRTIEGWKSGESKTFPAPENLAAKTDIKQNTLLPYFVANEHQRGA